MSIDSVRHKDKRTNIPTQELPGFVVQITLLVRADDPTGGQRGNAELAAAGTADVVVASWGASVPAGRDQRAIELLRGTRLMCLGTTKSGQPRHPLYVRRDQPLKEWQPGKMAQFQLATDSQSKVLHPA